MYINTFYFIFLKFKLLNSFSLKKSQFFCNQNNLFINKQSFFFHIRVLE
jgi:hypothetical protein